MRLLLSLTNTRDSNATGIKRDRSTRGALVHSGFAEANQALFYVTQGPRPPPLFFFISEFPNVQFNNGTRLLIYLLLLRPYR